MQTKEIKIIKEEVGVESPTEVRKHGKEKEKKDKKEKEKVKKEKER